MTPLNPPPTITNNSHDHTMKTTSIIEETQPTRVLRRRVKGWRMPKNTVSVCRPHRFGNPFKVGHKFTQAEAAERFQAWLTSPQDTFEQEKKQRILDGLESLRGKNLACFCPMGTPCHADVLLRLANPGQGEVEDGLVHAANAVDDALEPMAEAA